MDIHEVEDVEGVEEEVEGVDEEGEEVEEVVQEETKIWPCYLVKLRA